MSTREKLQCGWRVSCDQCGTIFDIPYRMNETRAHKPKYCSRACKAKTAKARADARLHERFWTNVEQRGPQECWPWKGRRSPAGYGLFDHGNRPQIASRFAFKLASGRFDLRPEECVCHSCDNPPCCNPGHLWLGSVADNMRDAASKGRLPNNAPRGEQHNHAKLTELDVRAIRLSGERTGVLAARYGISREQVRNIVRRLHWKDVA